MNLFRKSTPTPSRPANERERVMVERQTTAITFADHILADTTTWGVNAPDQCMALATGLLHLRWLIRTDRLSEYPPVEATP